MAEINQSIQHRNGKPMSEKEYIEYCEVFQRMEDGTYDDKIRSKNEKNV